MEGPFATATGAPMYTFEQFRAGNAPYVTAAMAGRPSGQFFYVDIPGIGSVPVRVTDTGGGLRSGQIDIASSNPAYATNFPYQGNVNLRDAPPVTVLPPAAQPPGPAAQGVPDWMLENFGVGAPRGTASGYPPGMEPPAPAAQPQRPYDLSTHGDVRFTAADWNRAGWAANPRSEPSEFGGGLMARLGMMGRMGGGKGGLVMPGRYQ